MNMHYEEELHWNCNTKVPFWYWGMESYNVGYYSVNVGYSLG